MILLGYANPCAVHVDPIEKKPLYHVLPGARAYSIAVAGCPFRCLNCQNHTISQASPLETRNTHLPPYAVVEQAVKNNCTTIAYTYSEPIAWYEYMYDTAKIARQAGLKNLWITCGYISETPLVELAKYIDAANIDLKGFDPKVYLELNAGKLEHILRTIKLARENGMWVELTNLIVPEWTDKLPVIRQLCQWVVKEVGRDVPLHFSRFHPENKLAHLPPTPKDVLLSAVKIAEEEGIRYVYVGNVAGLDFDTRCPSCHRPIIQRTGYMVRTYDIKNGACAHCGTKIAGIWEA
jgi:pyruvate formate lyase activating enzyme